MKLLLHSNTKLTASQLQELRSIRPGLEIVEQSVGPVDKLDGSGVSVLVSEQVPRDLARWTDLRWVQLRSAGSNQLRDHPILTTSIPVTNASGTHGVPIAQFVTCTWLTMAHRMPRVLDYKRSREWPNRLALGGFIVRGLTVGIIGYGSIGRECARQLHGLGMKVLSVKRDPKNRRDLDYNPWPGTGDPEGILPEAWFSPAQLHEMLPQCDLVVVAAPSTPSTVGMIGEAEFARMKKTARLILVSRGELVNESALAAALRTQQIAEAVVDCYVKEPLPPDHFFFDVPNLIMAPHMSGVYDGFEAALVTLIGVNLRRLESGLPLFNRVSAQNGY